MFFPLLYFPTLLCSIGNVSWQGRHTMHRRHGNPRILLLDICCVPSFFVPGGTIGVAPKWNSPCRSVCANSDLFCRHGCMRLRVMLHCGINQHQFEIGNSLGRLAMPEMKWFFLVSTARSAAFCRWMAGGANCNFVFLASMNISIDFEHLLSILWNLGRYPLLVSLAYVS